jgi:chromosome segregation ATPase
MSRRNGSDEETVMFGIRIPERLKRLVDADQRTNQEVGRTALWREFGGERRSEVEMKIDEKEKRREVIQKEIDRRRAELDDIDDQLAALREKRDQLGSAATAEIDDLIDDMLEYEMRIDPDADRVKRLSRQYYSGDLEACVSAIEQRADNRDDVDREVVR